MTRLALLIACLLLVAATPARAAQSGHAPPGNAAVDEYVEDLPDSEGDRPIGPDGAAGGGGGVSGGGGTGGGAAATGAPGAKSKLDVKTRKELARQGADGYRVAALTEQSAPGKNGKLGDAGSGGDSRLAASADALNGNAPGGMGAWLPILLGATAIAAVAAAVLSRRRA